MKDFKIEDLTLDSITVADAAIENPNSFTQDEMNATKLQFGLGFNKGLNLEEEKIMVKVFVQIDCLDENEKPNGVSARFTTQFIYSVNGLNEYIEKNESGSFVLNSGVSGSVLSTAYSTSRGIIYTRCLGTIMGDVLLPIVSVQYLLDVSEMKTKEEEQLEES